MKKSNLSSTILSLLMLFLSCSNDDSFRGSGNIVTESRDVSSFSKVYNPSSVNVVVMEGVSQVVELSADDNIISSVKTVVENGILKIDLAKGSYTDVTIDVAIVIPNLNGLQNTGSGNMTVSGFEDLDSLAIDNEGSGNVTLSGSGSLVTLKNSGSGSYKGFSFVAENFEVINLGSGNCEINCTGELGGSNSGSGSVLYKGNPSLDIINTGSGEIVDSN